MNLYSLVRNAPVSSLDPFGLAGIPDFMLLVQECNYQRCVYSMWKRRKEIRNRAIAEARAFSGGLGWNGGLEDSLRHCLAGCYLARAMAEVPACKWASPEVFIRDEELNRSGNRSQTDIDNGVVGSQAPPNVACLAYCVQARIDGRVKDENPDQGPLPK